jgi:hypothetical protein
MVDDTIEALETDWLEDRALEIARAPRTAEDAAKSRSEAQA